MSERLVPAKVEKLTPEGVEGALRGVPEWSEVGEAIQRTFQFPDFAAAMAFVAKVAAHAERVQHHPDIMIRYNKVTLTFSTHDAGGISAKDFEAAGQADGFAGASGMTAHKVTRKKK